MAVYVNNGQDRDDRYSQQGGVANRKHLSRWSHYTERDQTTVRRFVKIIAMDLVRPAENMETPWTTASTYNKIK